LVEEVEDIPTLLQALKDAIIDRERVEILRKFLAQGGEELFYLADRVRPFFDSETKPCLKHCRSLKSFQYSSSKPDGGGL
jgi:hypothetical protein